MKKITMTKAEKGKKSTPMSPKAKKPRAMKGMPAKLAAMSKGKKKS